MRGHGRNVAQRAEREARGEGRLEARPARVRNVEREDAVAQEGVRLGRQLARGDDGVEVGVAERLRQGEAARGRDAGEASP